MLLLYRLKYVCIPSLYGNYLNSDLFLMGLLCPTSRLQDMALDRKGFVLEQSLRGRKLFTSRSSQLSASSRYRESRPHQFEIYFFRQLLCLISLFYGRLVSFVLQFYHQVWSSSANNQNRFQILSSSVIKNMAFNFLNFLSHKCKRSQVPKR